jgi:dihydropyrimidine dehydrogenase (NAD+) subunit PreA
MVDLTIEFAGVEFPNPVWLGSGMPGRNDVRLIDFAKGGAGGIVTKTIVPDGTPSPKPRIAMTDCGMQNIELFTGLPPDVWFGKYLPAYKKETNVPLVVSVAGSNTEEFVLMAERAEEFADLIELNFSCPHFKGRGSDIGQVPELTEEITREVKKAVSVPVMPKLTPNITDPKVIAQAALKGGANALSAINTIKCIIGIDIYEEKPILPAIGGYSGKAVKPIALRHVYEITNAVDLPVCGIGGIERWQDVVEFFMVGALSTQICTGAMVHGPKLFSRITKGLEGFMDEKGYDTIKEMVGVAKKHFYESASLMPTEPTAQPVITDKCNLCKKCIRACSYYAIYEGDNQAIVDYEKCHRCGLCYYVCPIDAIELEKV